VRVSVRADPRFHGYLLNYFIDNYDGPSEVKVLAPFCYFRLGKTLAHGPDPKSLQEIEEIVRLGGPRSCTVLFGGTLEYIISLQAAEGVTLNVPEMLPILLNAIKKTGGYQTKGIFRVAADTVQVKNLVAQFSQGNYEVKATEPHVPADALKVWLRDLSEPIIPTYLYDQCLKLHDNMEKSVRLIKELPPPHADVLDFLFSFLHEIAQHEKTTSMGAENLAIVIGPNILRGEEKDPHQLLKNNQRIQNFTRNLIRGWRS